MTNTWVVVAHQAGARIFEHRPGFGHHLRLVHELENPDGRLMNQEIDSDRSGDIFTGMRSRGGRRGMHREHSAHEHVVTRFAHELAQHLSHSRTQDQFGELILVAEPKFLGLLRGSLDSATAQRVRGSATKDLAAVAHHDVASHLESVLPL